MTYVTEHMRAALAEHRLRQVVNANGVRVFRMAKPGSQLGFIDLVFLPDRIGVTGDCRTGLWSHLRCHFGWFLSAVAEEQVCDAFYCDDDVDRGHLCAIQQRFAELWREREARIEAIVAEWEWVEVPDETDNGHEYPYHRLMARPSRHATQAWPVPDGIAATVISDGYWHTYGSAPPERGDHDGPDAIDAAKLAARAAVLRQAKEHPGLWHCGEVDQ